MSVHRDRLPGFEGKPQVAWVAFFSWPRWDDLADVFVQVSGLAKLFATNGDSTFTKVCES
jgi:hypothetical protein